MNPIDILTLIVGAFLIVGVVFKPDFYWNSYRMKRRREVFGDQKLQVYFIILGIIMITVGFFRISMGS